MVYDFKMIKSKKVLVQSKSWVILRCLISSVKSVRESWKILRQKARCIFLHKNLFRSHLEPCGLWYHNSFTSLVEDSNNLYPLLFLFWSHRLIFCWSRKQEKRECFYLEHMMLYQRFCPNTVTYLLHLAIRQKLCRHIYGHKLITKL